MTESPWRHALAGRGARWGDGQVEDFGDAPAELEAARSAAVLCDLSPLALVAFQGPDAQSFLHGQLSSDVRALPEGNSALAAYCSPKGRMLAALLLWRRRNDHFVAVLPASIAPAFQKRIAMFVLRARLTVRDETGEWVRLGVGGPEAGQSLASALPALPAVNQSTRLAGEGAALGLPGGRFLLLTRPEQAMPTWDRLATAARPAGYPAWQWLEIASGIVALAPATVDAFVPQSANWEIVGGVDFRKGCYPGQEIVARTQYLGRLKERLFRLAASGPPPTPGTRIVSPLFGDQTAGIVTAAAPAPGGGSEMLAVIQSRAVADGQLRLDLPQAPALSVLPLPYPVPAGNAAAGER